MEEIRYPQPNDTLIKESGDKVLYADWMSGKWNFYADAYKEAADKLVDQIQEDWGPDDKLILPIIFMYRHFVELKLKWIIIHLDGFSGTRISDGLFNQHRLFELWIYLKNHLNCLRCGQLDKDIKNGLEKLIKELSSLDPESFRFRYSHDTRFNEVPLPERISMEHFKTTMGVIDNGLEYIEAGIYMEKEARDLDAELQVEMNSYMEDYY
jgi:hypothetical protein